MQNWRHLLILIFIIVGIVAFHIYSSNTTHGCDAYYDPYQPFFDASNSSLNYDPDIPCGTIPMRDIQTVGDLLQTLRGKWICKQPGDPVVVTYDISGDMCVMRLKDKCIPFRIITSSPVATEDGLIRFYLHSEKSDEDMVAYLMDHYNIVLPGSACYKFRETNAWTLEPLKFRRIG